MFISRKVFAELIDDDYGVKFYVQKVINTFRKKWSKVEQSGYFLLILAFYSKNEYGHIYR